MILLQVLQAFWFIAPAYAANAFPPLVRGKHPLDFGKNLNKNRLFGDGKTLEGTIFGIAFGTFIGVMQMLIQPYIAKETGIIEMNLLLIILISSGAVVGDILGAFTKRRFGIKRGDPAPLLDQLDFVVFAVVFASMIIVVPANIVIILLFVTPPIHWIANLIGYSSGVKKTPW